MLTLVLNPVKQNKMAASCKQIQITRTEGEWALIFKKIVPPAEKSTIAVQRHIRREVLKIKTRLKETPESITALGGRKIDKRFYIDKEIMKDIERIAIAMKVKPQIVIDRLIITPLLQPQP